MDWQANTGEMSENSQNTQYFYQLRELNTCAQLRSQRKSFVTPGAKN